MKTYNEQELDIIRRSGEILSATLLAVKKAIKPGISTLQLDSIAEKYITDNGGSPCFKDYRGYGFATCISVNEEIIHGKPRPDKILQEGDIISVDVGVRFNGFCTDAARTWGVGSISSGAQKLIKATEQCFAVAVNGLKAGCPVGQIGRNIEEFIKRETTYSLLTNYFGHGIGKSVHEEPLIPNYRPTNPKLKVICRYPLHAGAVICIEPMVNEGKNDTKTLADGWTVVTADGKRSAHYENTVIIRNDSVEVVTNKFC